MQLRKHVDQCFSIFLLQRNLPQMFASLMEAYAMIQVSTIAQNCGCKFGPSIFGLFRRNPWQPLAEPRLKNTDVDTQLMKRFKR